MRTPQELFNISARHLLNQGKRSVSEAGCAYRGNDGTKCAVGAVIPDEEYMPEMEGKAVCALVGGIWEDAPAGGSTELVHRHFLTPERREEFAEAQDLLTSLQSIHDSVREEEWKHFLENVAKNHGLSTEAIS